MTRRVDHRDGDEAVAQVGADGVREDGRGAAEQDELQELGASRSSGPRPGRTRRRGGASAAAAGRRGGRPRARRGRRGGVRRAGSGPGPPRRAPRVEAARSSKGRCRIATSARPSRSTRSWWPGGLSITSTSTAPGSAAYASSSLATSSLEAPALAVRTTARPRRPGGAPGAPLGRLDRGERRAALAQQRLAARSRERHAARPTDEQLGPEPALELAIARDSGGWAMPRRSAARPTCDSSATATK